MANFISVAGRINVSRVTPLDAPWNSLSLAVMCGEVMRQGMTGDLDSHLVLLNPPVRHRASHITA